jgi:hypothetical protein
MATVYDPTQRQMRGGARWMYKRVKGDGSDLDTPDDWHEGPAIKESNLKDDTSQESYEIESGEEFFQDGKRSVEWGGMFAQNDPATKSLMTTETVLDGGNYTGGLRDQYIAILKEEATRAINGQYPKLFIPAAKTVPSTDRKLPGGEIPFMFKPAALSDSMTVNLATDFDAALTAKQKGTFTGTQSLAPGAFYKDFAIS